MSDDEVKLKSNKVIYIITFNNFVSDYVQDEDSQDDHPEAWSPAVIQQRRNRDRVTREDMYSRALQLAKSLANELQNIPLPAFEGYLQVLEQIKLCIRRNEPMHLIYNWGYEIFLTLNI